MSACLCIEVGRKIMVNIFDEVLYLAVLSRGNKAAVIVQYIRQFHKIK